MSKELESANDGEIIAAEWLTHRELKLIEKDFRNPITKTCIDDFLQYENIL